MTTPNLPVGEKLPEYDDGPADGIDVLKLHRWLVAHRKSGSSPRYNEALIREVLDALQAVGDATLVKNATYRAMRRDGARVERLAAWLANHGEHTAVLDADGDPVEGAITALVLAQEYQQRSPKG